MTNALVQHITIGLGRGEWRGRGGQAPIILEWGREGAIYTLASPIIHPYFRSMSMRNSKSRSQIYQVEGLNVLYVPFDFFEGIGVYLSILYLILLYYQILRCGT